MYGRYTTRVDLNVGMDQGCTYLVVYMHILAFGAGESRDLEHLPGPRSVSFGGRRFRVDKERNYVSWMGWGLFTGFNRDIGLSLWDVRFKGERLIYQVRFPSPL